MVSKDVGDFLGIGKALEATGELTKEFRQFCYDIAGPWAKEVGEDLASKRRFRRIQNTIRLFEDTQRMLDAAGQSPQSVPPKLLEPILELSELEEDEDLRSRWAGLLASAASGQAVPPSYPRILAELTPAEAKVLDEMYSKGSDTYYLVGFPPDKRAESRLIMASLQRHGLSAPLVKADEALERFMRTIDSIQGNPRHPSTTGEIVTKLKQAASSFQSDSSLHSVPTTDSYQLTELGRDFVRTCKGPAP